MGKAKEPITAPLEKPRTLDQIAERCAWDAKQGVLPSWPKVHTLDTSRLYEIGTALYAFRANDLEAIMMARELIALRLQAREQRDPESSE